MNATTQCPTLKVLRDLIDGRLVDPELSVYSSHLEDCIECQSRIQSLYSSDSLIKTLRNDAAIAETITERISHDLIDALKRIPAMDTEIQRSANGLRRDNGLSLDDLGLSFLTPPVEPDEIGRLGVYRVLRILGRGGMGTVFLAQDPKLGRQVALKVMLPKIANIPAARDRFLREAKAAASLKNDHIVTVYQVDEFNGIPFLAMELLKGESLEESLQSGQRFSVLETIHIARDIARGLADAHEKGLVHRDIKPANLWLETIKLSRSSDRAQPGSGVAALSDAVRVKILDFGLARLEVEDINITEFGTIVGTPAFMAPEQARADRAIDSRADLFSLGCVLYVLCTGEIPFKAETTVGVLMALALNTPASPRQRNEDVSEDLSNLIMQLLEKDPARRPQSARDVVDRLRQIERSLMAETPSHPGTLLGASGETLLGVSKPVSASPEPVTQPQGLSKSRALRIATGICFVVLMLFAQVYFWKTADGRIVRVECNDPSIMLAFGNGELRVTGAYDQPVTVAPGKIDLKITKPQPDGTNFEFETDKLIVRKGDKIALKIEVLEGEIRVVQDGNRVVDSKLLPSAKFPQGSSSLPLESITDIDRRAAMWVLSVGGNITIDSLAPEGTDDTIGNFRQIDTIAQLPAKRFVVTSVSFQNIRPFDGAGFVHLRDLKFLQTLRVEGDYELVTDSAFENLRGCTRLSDIAVSGCRVSDGIIDSIKDLPSLQSVGVSGKPGLTDAALESLKNVRALTKLYIGGARLTDSGLRHLSDFQHLENFGIAGCDQITDAGLLHLGDVKTLRVVDLAATKVGDATMERLGTLPGLSELSISYTQVTDRGLESLQTCKELRFIWAMYTSVTLDAVERFHTAVPACRIEFGTEDARMAYDINGMTDSKSLLTGAEQFTILTDAMRRANPGFDGTMTPTFERGMLVGLDFKTDHVTDISPLHELKHLRSLRMAGNYSSTLSDLSALEGLPLSILDISNCPQVTDLTPLKGMAIRELRVDGCHIADFAPLAGMPLNILMAWTWSGSDLSPLEGMPLTQLNIGGNGKFMDLTPLAGAPLEFLCCNSSGVSDLTPLKGLPLKTLMCENTGVSDLGPLRNTPLREFIAGRCPISDFSVLRELSLTWVKFDIVADRDLEMLRGIKTLVRINDQRASDFLKEFSEDRGSRPVSPAFTNNIGMEFVQIPKGKAWLARKVGEEVTTNAHETVFSDDFFLGMYEVTQEEWSKVMGSNPSWFTRKAEGENDIKSLPDDILRRLPVERVSWTDCQLFLAKLNEQDATPGWVYRLPTEAEWQYACRGGSMTDASQGEYAFCIKALTNELTFEDANVQHPEGWFRPCRVGTFAPNPLGLYDMHGNVWEWCQDAAPWRETPSRFIHGGGWNEPASVSGASQIKQPTEPWTYYDLGLRVARVPAK